MGGGLSRPPGPERGVELLPVFAKRWFANATTTERADRRCAEAGLRLVYSRMGGLPMPRCRWARSPREAIRWLRRDPDGGWVPGLRLLPNPLHRSQSEGLLAERLESPLRRSIVEGVVGVIREALREEARPFGFDLLQRPWLGQHETAAAVAAFRQEVQDFDPDPDLTTGMVLLSQSAGWIWPGRDECVLADRPRILLLDEQGRLHHESGPALVYRDGWSVYAWHGSLVSPDVIESPSGVSIEEVLGAVNLEYRRFLLDRVGLDRFIDEGLAHRIQADECGDLYRCLLPGEEPLILVRVINATPEPDGSRRRYTLRVPPEVQTARQAVAWTFGMEAAEYRPWSQT